MSYARIHTDPPASQTVVHRTIYTQNAVQRLRIYREASTHLSLKEIQILFEFLSEFLS